MSAIKGAWRFIETPEFSSGVEQTVSFTTSNGDEFGRIAFSTSYMEFVSLSNESHHAYHSYLWDNPWYRFIDFGEDEQTVSDDFYNWFIGNAVQLSSEYVTIANETADTIYIVMYEYRGLEDYNRVFADNLETNTSIKIHNNESYSVNVFRAHKGTNGSDTILTPLINGEYVDGKDSYSAAYAEPIAISSGTAIAFDENSLEVGADYRWGIKFAEEQNESKDNYLVFSSPNSFTLSVVDNKKYWDGTLECSLDAINWGVWDGLSTVFAGDGRLYVRGTGNTYITGDGTSSTKGAWRLGGSNISISGNIETILDYATVARGEHPAMADLAFRVLFAYPFSEETGTGGDENGTIIDASHLELPAMTLTYGCYWAMFQGCTGLCKAPSLPAQTLAYACYAHMFALCGLRSSPSLPATAIAEACYSGMFRRCKNLTTIPSLPATSLVRGCYYGMFEQCSKLVIATSKTEECSIEYRIPSSGTGVPEEDSVYGMFAGTHGVFEETDGTPSINTIYYLGEYNTDGSESGVDGEGTLVIFDLGELNLAAGTYSVVVRAKGINLKDSSDSVEITYEVGA